MKKPEMHGPRMRCRTPSTGLSGAPSGTSWTSPTFCDRRSRQWRTALKFGNASASGTAYFQIPGINCPSWKSRTSWKTEILFICLINQAAGDREILAEWLNISSEEFAYVANSEPDYRPLFFSNVILSFADDLPKDIEFYKRLTTKPIEVINSFQLFTHARM